MKAASALPAIHQVIFYQPARGEMSIIESLRDLGERELPSAKWRIILRESELISALNSETLLVSNVVPGGRLGEILYSAGSAFYLPLQKFYRTAPLMLQRMYPHHLGDVVLAWLPLHLRYILKGMFTLFGYNVHIVENIQSLQKVVTAGASYAVFNQDMFCEQGSCDNREKILQIFKQEKFKREQFAVNVIKDFEQGSLFSDINSSVRDVSNTLLSPEEYLVFIQKYLYSFNIKKIEERYADVLSNNPAGSSARQRNRKESYHISNALRDSKKIFLALQQSEEERWSTLRHNYFLELQTLEMKMSLLEWMEDYFSYRAEKHSQGTFTFMSRAEENPDKSANPQITLRENYSQENRFADY